jgi:hypothetical protein
VVAKIVKKRPTTEAMSNPERKAVKLATAPLAGAAPSNILAAAPIPTQFMKTTHGTAAPFFNPQQTLKTPIDGGLLPPELSSEDLRLMAAAFSTPPGATSLQLRNPGITENTYPFKQQGSTGAAAYFHSVQRPGLQPHNSITFGANLRGTSTESEALCLQQMFTEHEDVNGAMFQIDNELHRLLGGGSTVNGGGGNGSAPSVLGGTQQKLMIHDNSVSNTTKRTFTCLFSPQYELTGLP